MDTTRCKKYVTKGWHSFQCKRKHIKDGFCFQHHPDFVRKRQEDSDKRFEEQKKKSPWYLLGEANNRIKELEKRILELETGLNRERSK